MISEVPLRTAVVKLSAGRWAGLAEALMWSRVREPLLPTVAGRCCLARVRPTAKRLTWMVFRALQTGQFVLALWRRHEDAPRLIAALCPLLLLFPTASLPTCCCSTCSLLDALSAPHSATEGRVTTMHCRLYKPLRLVGWQRGLLAREFDCAPATHHTPTPLRPGTTPPPTTTRPHAQSLCSARTERR